MCVCCVVGPLLCPAASWCLMYVIFSNIPLNVPFPFLVSFTWSLEISKFPFTWNYTLIHNSMFVVVVHYCVQLLPGVMLFF